MILITGAIVYTLVTTGGGHVTIAGGLTIITIGVGTIMDGDITMDTVMDIIMDTGMDTGMDIIMEVEVTPTITTVRKEHLITMVTEGLCQAPGKTEQIVETEAVVPSKELRGVMLIPL